MVQNSMTAEYERNRASYPAHGLPAYKNGAGEHRRRALFDVSGDWRVGDEVPEVCLCSLDFGGQGRGMLVFVLFGT